MSPELWPVRLHLRKCACIWHQHAAVEVTEDVLCRCFEVASLPDTTPEQRKKLLSFIVVSACSRLNAWQ